MLARPKTGGFYNAPVSKGLLLLNGSASLLNILLASSSSIKKLLPNYEWLEIVHHFKLFQALSSTIYFSNARDLLCGSVLLYTFRIFERRYGSRKYASFVFASTIITVGLQLIAVYGIKNLGHNIGPLPSGLYGVIFSSLVQYFFDVPAVDAVTILGIPISGKVLSYSISLQMLLGGKGSIVAGTCGMIAGLIYKGNLAYVQSWLKLPNFIYDISKKTIGWLFISNNDQPISSSTMGATEEIQEQQQMEWYEQQMWRRAMAANAAHPRARARAGQGYAEVMLPQGGGLRDWLWGPENGQGMPPNDWQPMMNHHGNIDEASQNPAVEVSEEQVQTLVDMGFSRHDVLQALSVTNNDVHSATSVLLSHSS